MILPFLWPFIWVAPVPFLFAIFSQTHTATRKQALYAGALFGFTLNLAVSASAWSAYPLDWIGIPNPYASLLIIASVSMGSSLCMGVAHALLALCVYEVRTRIHSVVPLITTLPFLWVTAEWLQAVLYSIYALGPTSTVQAFSQVASVGYALGHASNPVWIALARFGDTPLLSAFPVLVSSCLALALCFRRDRRRFVFALVGAGSVFVVFLGSSALALHTAELSRGMTLAWGTTDSLIFVVGKTDFPAQYVQTPDVLVARNDIVYTVAKELRAKDISPDVVIMPETVGNWLDDDNYTRISKLFPEEMLLVHSKYGYGNPRTAQTYSHVIGGDTFVTDKQFLMPYGEYPPYHFLVLLKTLSPAIYANILAHREYVSGTREEMGHAQGVRIGVRLCSEIYASQLFHSLAKNGAGVLVQSSSIQLFEGTPVLQWTMRSAARIRAVENGLPLVQVMNGAPSSAFDCTGKELSPLLTTTNFDVYEIARTDVCR